MFFFNDFSLFICLVSALEFTIYILTYQKQLQIYTNLIQMSYRKHYSYMALFPFSCFCGIALRVCVCLLKTLRGKRTAIIFLQVFVNMNSYHFWLSSFIPVESNYYLGYQITIWGHSFNPMELCHHLPPLYYRNRKYIIFLYVISSKIYTVLFFINFYWSTVAFQIEVLEKTLERPLDSKEIK